jgi:hypothetical protein
MYPLIALWAHPRSLSTVTARVMLQRGDFRVFNEPFSYVYYLHDNKGSPDPLLDRDPTRPTSYPEVKHWLLQAAENQPVFFKDMSHHAYAHLQHDEPFLRRITHTFLIRDPAKALLSYYRITPDFVLEEVGLERQYHHFQLVTGLTGSPPILIDADDLTRNPAGVLRAYCATLGIPFLPHALHWQTGLPQTWRDWGSWHGTLEASTGFRAKGGSHTASIDTVPHLRQYHAHHLPFYQALYPYRLRPFSGEQQE